MNRSIFVSTSVAVLAFACSSAASAVPLLFNFSGPSGTAVFQLDSNPTPNTSTAFLGSTQFSFTNVAGTFGGVTGTASTISFGSGSIYSSFSLTAPNLGFTQFSNPTLFTGPQTSPTFLIGSFTLINPFFGNGSLIISAAPGAVPEPAMWGMMILGLGMVGGSLRRRRNVTTWVSYAV